MNAKTMRVLLVATVLVVVGAFAAQRFSLSSSKAPDLPEHVVPGLSDKLNDVASVAVSSRGKTVELAKNGNDWVVASSAGYPAKFETVKQALVELADLKPRERKTADPARYSRLGLEEPAEAKDSVSVELKDKGGAEIAKLILGNEVQGGSASQRYVRVASDPQTWLAEGKASPATDPMQWMDRELMRIPRDRVTRVTITHPDGEVVHLEREQGGTNYTLTDPPEGRNPKSAGEVGAPASALAYLRFDDVRKADSPGFDLGDPTTAAYETADGLHVTVKTWQVDGKTWASFAVEFVAPPAPENAEPAKPDDGSPKPAGDDPAGAGTGAPTGDAAEGADKPKQADKDEATKKEAADLASKLSGWLYQIPEYQAGSFRKHLADLTDEPKPEATPDANGAQLPATGDEEPVFVPSPDAKDPGSGG